MFTVTVISCLPRDANANKIQTNKNQTSTKNDVKNEVPELQQKLRVTVRNPSLVNNEAAKNVKVNSAGINRNIIKNTNTTTNAPNKIGLTSKQKRPESTKLTTTTTKTTKSENNRTEETAIAANLKTNENIGKNKINNNKLPKRKMVKFDRNFKKNLIKNQKQQQQQQQQNQTQNTKHLQPQTKLNVTTSTDKYTLGKSMSTKIHPKKSNNKLNKSNDKLHKSKVKELPTTSKKSKTSINSVKSLPTTKIKYDRKYAQNTSDTIIGVESNVLLVTDGHKNDHQISFSADKSNKKNEQNKDKVTNIQLNSETETETENENQNDAYALNQINQNKFNLDAVDKEILQKIFQKYIESKKLKCQDNEIATTLEQLFEQIKRVDKAAAAAAAATAQKQNQNQTNITHQNQTNITHQNQTNITHQNQTNITHQNQTNITNQNCTTECQSCTISNEYQRNQHPKSQTLQNQQDIEKISNIPSPNHLQYVLRNTQSHSGSIYKILDHLKSEFSSIDRKGTKKTGATKLPAIKATTTIPIATKQLKTQKQPQQHQLQQQKQIPKRGIYNNRISESNNAISRRYTTTAFGQNDFTSASTSRNVPRSPKSYDFSFSQYPTTTINKVNKRDVGYRDVPPFTGEETNVCVTKRMLSWKNKVEKLYKGNNTPSYSRPIFKIQKPESKITTTSTAELVNMYNNLQKECLNNQKPKKESDVEVFLRKEDYSASPTVKRNERPQYTRLGEFIFGNSACAIPETPTTSKAANERIPRRITPTSTDVNDRKDISRNPTANKNLNNITNGPATVKHNLVIYDYGNNGQPGEFVTKETKEKLLKEAAEIRKNKIITKPAFKISDVHREILHKNKDSFAKQNSNNEPGPFLVDVVKDKMARVSTVDKDVVVMVIDDKIKNEKSVLENPTLNENYSFLTKLPKNYLEPQKKVEDKCDNEVKNTTNNENMENINSSYNLIENLNAHKTKNSEKQI